MTSLEARSTLESGDRNLKFPMTLNKLSIIDVQYSAGATMNEFTRSIGFDGVLEIPCVVVCVIVAVTLSSINVFSSVLRSVMSQ